MSRRITMTGAKELDRALRDLPGAMGDNVLRGALRQGGNVIKNAGNARVGDKRALVVKSRRAKKGLARVVVKLNPKKWYLRFLEFGAAPHIIKASDGKVLANTAGDVFGKIVHHPGMAARPFLRPAADANVGKVVAVIGKEIGKRIGEAARKINTGKVNALTGRKK